MDLETSDFLHLGGSYPLEVVDMADAADAADVADVAGGTVNHSS